MGEDVSKGIIPTGKLIVLHLTNSIMSLAQKGGAEPWACGLTQFPLDS